MVDLDIGDLRIRDIGDALTPATFSSLTELSLSWNTLTAVRGLLSLPCLRILNLDGNRLSAGTPPLFSRSLSAAASPLPAPAEPPPSLSASPSPERDAPASACQDRAAGRDPPGDAALAVDPPLLAERAHPSRGASGGDSSGRDADVLEPEAVLPSLQVRVACLAVPHHA